jgi:hypothetical protein
MAHTLAVNDILKMQVVCTRGVQTSLNTVYYSVASITGTSVTDSQTAAQMDTTLSPLVKPMINTTAAYYGTLIQKILPVPVSAYKIAKTNAGAGTGGAAAPDELCGLVAAKTENAGRAFRGRLYSPFLYLSAIDSGELDVTSAYLALLGAFATAVYTAWTINPGGGTANLTPIVFHKKANKAGTTAPGTGTPITGFVLELLLATQRRRGARGRANAPPL